MASARVTLVAGPVKYDVGSFSFERGKPQVISDVSIIKRLKPNKDFSVVMLGEPAAPVAAAAAPSKAKRSAAPPPPVDDDEDDDEEDEDGEEEGDEDGDGDGEEDGPPVPSRAELKGMKLPALRELAKESGVKVDADASKNVIIDALLAAAGADEDG